MVRSVFLLSEQNARHVCGVLRYLKRTDTTLPPELLEFALGVQQAKEQLKADRALCSYLKSLGFCRYYHAVQFVCMYVYMAFRMNMFSATFSNFVWQDIVCVTTQCFFLHIETKNVAQTDILSTKSLIIPSTQTLGLFW